MKRLLLLLFFVFIAFHAPGQKNIYTHLGGAERRGDLMFARFSYTEALSAYQQAYKNNSEQDQLSLKIAATLMKLNDPGAAVEWYVKAVEKEIDLDSEHMIRYADALTSIEKYEEAKKWYKIYLESVNSDRRSENKLKGLVDQRKFYKNVSKIVVKKAGFNSEASDFSPAFYGDQVVFPSARKDKKIIPLLFNWDNSRFLDLYQADTQDEVVKFSENINTKYHEGPLVFYDRDTRVIFTRTNYSKGRIKRSEEGIARLKLYTSRKLDDGTWSPAVPMPFNGDEYSVGHPAISSDGLVLYFVSDKPGGFGGTDVYKTEFTDSAWQTPVNLGERVNTEGDEMFPFLHNDRYLYFASDGHGGLGGLDIFGMDLSKDDQAKATNVGAPINSALDDFGIILRESGMKGYFSSNREGSRSFDDIYEFITQVPLIMNRQVNGVVYREPDDVPLPEAQVFLMENGKRIDSATTDERGRYTMSVEAGRNYELQAMKPDFLTALVAIATFDPDIETYDANFYLGEDHGFDLYGLISEKQSLEPVEKVKVIIIDNFNGEIVLQSQTTNQGSFSYAIDDKELNDRVSYQIKLEKEGYLGKAVTFNGSLEKPGRIDLRDFIDLDLDKIEIGADIGKLIDLKPIYFDLGKSNIRPDAAAELDKIVQIMKENPSLEIELGAHTDSRGSASGNLSLSGKRAKASVDYIVSQGIDPGRIVGKGYGESRLINYCADGVKCSDELHQLNRRTEFKIVKI